MRPALSVHITTGRPCPHLKEESSKDSKAGPSVAGQMLETSCRLLAKARAALASKRCAPVQDLRRAGASARLWASKPALSGKAAQAAQAQRRSSAAALSTPALRSACTRPELKELPLSCARRPSQAPKLAFLWRQPETRVPLVCPCQAAQAPAGVGSRASSR